MSSAVEEKQVVDVHEQEASQNKISNEEFKIWKKAVPTFYKHISTFKPRFAKNVSHQNKLHQTVIFTDKIFPDRAQGTLTTSVLYALGSSIYEVDVVLPLGVHLDGADGAVSTQPMYESFLRTFEETQFEPKWTVGNDTVEKLVLLNSNGIKFAALTTQGAVMWFKDEISTPQSQCLPDSVENGAKTTVDFDVSTDMNTVLLVSSSSKEDETQKVTTSTTVKIIDNKDTVGEVKRIIKISDIPEQCISCSFLSGADVAALCFANGSIRLWDLTKSLDTPAWNLTDAVDGKLTLLKVSGLVPTLFATGSDNGTVKLWDWRTLQSHSVIDVGKTVSVDEKKLHELVKLTHYESDPVVDIIFSETSACKLISVGATGNVYHWDLSFVFSQELTDDDDDESFDDAVLESECLSFYHTGGCRRAIGSGSSSQRNRVASDAIIDDLTCCVDADGLLSVYIPFTARIESDATE